MINLLQLGKRALAVNELQLQITGNNIANVNTEGYSRQSVVQTAADSISNSLGYCGTGVDVTQVERLRDLYLDDTYRQEYSRMSTWSGVSDRLSSLEESLLEPSDYGLTSLLNEFYDTWEALADNPTDGTYRQDLLEKAQDVVDAFHNVTTQIDTTRSAVNDDIAGMADEVNSIASQLAQINLQIQQAESQGVSANDLEDQYDLLLDQLSAYGDVSVQETDSGRIVYLGSDELVKGDSFRSLSAVDSFNADGLACTDLIWDDTRESISGLTEGSIVGMTDLRDNTLTSYKNTIDDIAVHFAGTINSIHSTGYGLGDPPPSGLNFFDPSVTGAADIQLSSDIANRPNAIAVSLTGAEGDNQIALAIADLRSGTSYNGKSYGDVLGEYFGQIGRDSLNADNYTTAYTATSSQIDTLRESVKGVSLNEEAANLIKFQQSFQAAAKLVQAADNLLNTVIGLVQ